jgi:signal peptidase I
VRLRNRRRDRRQGDESSGRDGDRPQARSRRRFLLELPLLVVIAAVVALLLKTFLVQAYSIPSGSMTPQLEVGDRVAVSSLADRLHEPRRGDIVVFDSPAASPDDESTLAVRVGRDLLEGIGLVSPDDDALIKRVIGLPGEEIQARDGRVFIDARELIEPYLPEAVVTEDFGPVVVPDDAVFVLGDNRANSQDSRFIGPIPADSITGRAIARIWPPDRLAYL